MIEWRWNLEPLTVRDESANNLAEVLDFAAPDLKAKQFQVEDGFFGGLCSPTALTAEDEWLPLLQIAANSGWPVQLR
jgi:phospholipase C